MRSLIFDILVKISVICGFFYVFFISFSNFSVHLPKINGTEIENTVKSAVKIQKLITGSSGVLPFPNKEISSVIVKDANGEVIANIVPDAYISNKRFTANSPEVISLMFIEDSSFLNRSEIINIKGLIRATISTIRGKQQGGSGITQQIIKNTFLKEEDGLKRKLLELFYTYNIEKVYSKIDILNYYLNTSSYGKNISGISQAGKIYLGKDTLTLGDSFVLNSLLKKPTALLKDQEELKDRALYYYKNFCSLSKCENNEEEYIKNIKLSFKTENIRNGNDYIIDMAIAEIKEKGINDEITLNYSPVQSDSYKKIDSEIAKWEEFSCKKYATCDIGAIVLGKGGEIRYLYSGDYSKSQVNILSREFQPGSTLKPFVYTEYFDAYPNTQSVSNASTCIGSWCPDNWNNKSSGNVSLQTAINLSLNLPVLHMYKTLGGDNVFNKFVDIGLFDKNEEIGDSFIIGGFPVELISLANAYRVFINDGEYSPFSLIKGNTAKSNPFLPESINKMRNILINVPDYKGNFGIKTGTTNNWKDQYIVMFDNDNIILIWGGNRDGSPTSAGTFSIPKLKPVADVIINELGLGIKK